MDFLGYAKRTPTYFAWKRWEIDLFYALSTDIDPKPNSSAPDESRQPLFTRSDNTFRFNFLADSNTAPQEETVPSTSVEPTTNHVSFTGQNSAFAFNFQIPTDTPAESMDTTEASSHGTQQEQTPSLSEVIPPSETSGQIKAKKKKKKSGKKKAESAETQEKTDAAAGSPKDKDTELVSAKYLQ